MNQMVLKNSKISIKEAQKIVALNYDIKGSVEKLDGEIDFNYLEQLLKGFDKTLVSLMHVNNEVGNLLDLERTKIKVSGIVTIKFRQ